MKMRSGAALLAAVLVSSTLTSCSVLGLQPESCVSWIDVSDPQMAYDEAEAVIIGTSSATGKTANLYGVNAAVHEIEISEVVKGDDLAGEPTVLVVSTPVTCTGGEIYPDGDPLDVEGELIMFLNRPESGGAWQLITPFDTVLPAEDNALLGVTSALN